MTMPRNPRSTALGPDQSPIDRRDVERAGLAPRSPVRLAAMIVGWTFILVGLLGFVPGITQHLGDIKLASHDSDAKLLGVFEVSVLHNLTHLLLGIVGVVLSRRDSWARAYLLVGGLVYLALALYGFVIDKASDANFVPVNRADDWLHVVLGAGMIALGLLLGRRPASVPGRLAAARASTASGPVR